MNSIYISRTNRVEEEDFETLLVGLQALCAPGTKLHYFEKGQLTTASVNQCDTLIVIPTPDFHNDGYIGKGVHKQMNEAWSKNIPVYVYDSVGDMIINFNEKDLCFHINIGEDWNRVAELDWEAVHVENRYSINSFVNHISVREKKKEDVMPWDEDMNLDSTCEEEFEHVEEECVDPYITIDKRILFRLR